MESVLPKWIPAAALLLIAIFACAGGAAAQEIPTEVRPGAFIAAGATFSDYQIDYGQNKLSGPSVFVDVHLTTHYGVEGEARWLVLNQAQNVHATTWLVGPRATFDPSVLHGVTPYVKLLVGDAHFNFPYNYATGEYFVLAPGAGVDLPIGHRLTIRLIDVEYQSWPQFTFGGLHPYGASIGLSYRILPRY